MTVIGARKDDTADAYAEWLRTPRWRVLRRRSLRRVVDNLMDDLVRLQKRQGAKP